MTRQEFYKIIDEIVEEDPGTVKGGERLDELEGWDSLSVVAFIGAMDKHLKAQVQPALLAKAETVDDLLGLVSEKIED